MATKPTKTKGGYTPAPAQVGAAQKTPKGGSSLKEPPPKKAEVTFASAASAAQTRDAMKAKRVKTPRAPAARTAVPTGPEPKVLEKKGDLPRCPPSPRIRAPDIFGVTHTDRFRLRETLFGVKVERLLIRADGTSKWTRYRKPLDLKL